MKNANTSNVESALERLKWQSALFADRPLRSRLLELTQVWRCDEIDIRIHRNHSFEHVASAMGPFLAYGGWRANYHYSDYDDSLSFGGWFNEDVHVNLIWLDFARYRTQLATVSLARWLGDRLEHLRHTSTAPILVANWASNEPEARAFNDELVEIAHPLPGVHIVDLVSLKEQLGERFSDARASRWSGTRMSDQACVFAARELGLRWLPGVLRPRLKAIALDLDHTLYEGVLGEDGPEGVVLTSGHVDLQQRLRELHSEGIYLALVSRNDRRDVQNLFSRRRDFPLSWEHFSASSIGWLEKGEGLIQVADALRVGIDTIVFVDDNPGELASVAQVCPYVNLIHADSDAALTARVLASYPGLRSGTAGEADALRISDLKATGERERLKQRSEPEAYLRSLQIRITLSVNARNHLSRSAELSQKTNQFNLNLSRLNESEIARRLGSIDHRIVNIRLTDRLADSGVIGLIIGRWEADVLVVEEACISCRALGRNLEDLMIRRSVQLLLAGRNPRQVDFEFQVGPRNDPARNWLARVSGRDLSEPSGRILAPAHFWLTDPTGKPTDVPIEFVYEA